MATQELLTKQEEELIGRLTASSIKVVKEAQKDGGEPSDGAEARKISVTITVSLDKPRTIGIKIEW